VRSILSISLCVALMAAGPASAVNVRAVFAPVAARLKSTVRIPVLLPDRLPPAFAGEKLFPIVDRASASGYAVDIALARDCRGEHACSSGHVYGSKTPIAQADVPAGGVRAMIDGETPALYRASVAGPYPSDGYLSWKKNGTYYALALNAGSLADLLLAARSMR
jgi:hypothetical protein